MQITGNKTIYGLTICCVLALIIFVVVLVNYLIKTSIYEHVEARIITNFTQYARRSSAKSNFVTYEFLFNGKKYQATKQVITKIGKTVGKTEYIRCNPNNPEEIAQTFLFQIYCFIIVALSIVIFILVRYYFRRRG